MCVRQIKNELMDDLDKRRQKILGMGGPANLEKQRGKGKLTARERIERLLDAGSFVETGIFARNRTTTKTEVPSDAVITGYGKIAGQRVYIFSQDFTCAGGTVSEIHAKKICNLLDNAVKMGCPVIGINDSGGARIQDGVDSLAGYGQIFYRNTMA